MGLAGKPRVDRRFYPMKGLEFRFGQRVEIGIGRNDNPARPAAGAAPADTRVRNVVGSADLQHRHSHTSDRGQAAIVGDHDAGAPSSEDVRGKNGQRRRYGHAVDQKDPALNDVQTMTHLPQHQQVLLDEGPPTRVGRESRQYRLASMRKTEKGKDRDHEQYRNDNRRQPWPDRPQHQCGIKTNGAVNPDDDHHEELLECQQRRVLPVNGEHVPVIGTETSHEIARHGKSDDMIDQQGRRPETQEQLDPIRPAHHQRMTRGE